jgi:hypothetical protein
LDIGDELAGHGGRFGATALGWYDTWVHQPNSGSDFVATQANGTTTVRLGVNRVVLNAVPLAAGESRTAKGTFNLPSSTTATLQVQATLTDAGGAVLVKNGGSCLSTEGAAPR